LTTRSIILDMTESLEHFDDVQYIEDKMLIKNLYVYKGYNARQFIREFPDKGWTKNSINNLTCRCCWRSSESSEQSTC